MKRKQMGILTPALALLLILAGCVGQVAAPRASRCRRSHPNHGAGR